MDTPRNLVLSLHLGLKLTVAALSVVALSACASGAAVPASPTVSASSAPVDPMVAAPLSGEYFAASTLAHASLAAKVDNHEEARPQWGLNQTDVVFEELVEGGLTRYVAIWHSQVPPVIGPVRSIRPMDPDIITPFLGIVAYSGGQQKFVSMMRDTPVYNAVHGQSDTEEFMYRDDSKDAPHNVAVKAPGLIAAHSDLKAPQKMFLFPFDRQGVFSSWQGTPSPQINIRFSDARYPSWTYDPATKTYLRSQEGEPDFDSNKQRIAATNVIIMNVEIDNTYGYVPKTVMVGSGKGYIATRGIYTPMNWAKKSATDPIVFTDDQGRVLTINRGNTWIEMPPTYGSVTFAK